jgi:hypothetical protein
MLVDEAEHSLFDIRSKRLYRIEGEREASFSVGMKIADCRMRAMRGERHGKPSGCDGKDDVQERV